MKSIPTIILTLIIAPSFIEKGHLQTTDQATVARIRTLKEGNNFKPPATKEAWLARRKQIRERILVATGLYPMPDKTPLHPRIYGKIVRDGYTVEKVVLETLPGFYLSGNLYRPIGASEKRPGILNPHGHWKEGRFTADLQARCIGQARMGAIAFLYDMVGFGDSKPLQHAVMLGLDPSKPFKHAFMDDELATLGFNLTSLQLWDGIRALDWLLTLPDVDPTRIACTGESGGGTQTFLLSAVDDRIQVSAPVCMVSHHYQGGCICENAPLLRVGTDNVEIAASFAPKPLILVGATGDWTSQIMEHGVPEIRAVYKLFGAEGNFNAVAHNANHNYNQASRESVYTFLKQHLWGDSSNGLAKEAPFTSEDEKTLSTWDGEHPRPAQAADAAALKNYLREMVARQVDGWKPVTAAQWQNAKAIVRTGLATILACEMPEAADLVVEPKGSFNAEKPTRDSERFVLSRKGIENRTEVLLRSFSRQSKHPTATVIIYPARLDEALQDKTLVALMDNLRQHGHEVLLVEPFLAGQSEAVANRQSSQFYTTYNPTVLAERVQDILNAVTYAHKRAKKVNLVGLGGAGSWVLLARPFAGDVRRTVADASQWEWPTTLAVTDEMALPGALRYGGMKAFIALSSPNPLFLHNYGIGLDVSWLQSAYQLEGKDNLRVFPRLAASEIVAAWLTKSR